MNVLRDSTWMRRGVSLLWDPRLLGEAARPGEVLSLRSFWALARAWPDELPSNGGDAVVVAGLQAVLDVLAPGDAEAWLREDLKERVLSFQDRYENQAALVFWLPAGRKHLAMAPATGSYAWHTRDGELSLGPCLWGGAESDVRRILAGGADALDADGEAWAGLYHPRIS